MSITNNDIEMAKTKDPVAFEKIYKETIKGAYYVARKLMGADTRVEDVIQDSYIKVYENLGKYKTGNFQGWVDTIVANTCRDYFKKESPILFSQMANDNGMEFESEETSEEFNPDANVDYEETKRIVSEIIDKLPADQRMSVVLFYYEQLGVKEIAKICECSENTIKSRLNYARKSIKSEVEKLEKKGTKLYSVSVIPFIMWLFKEEAKACQVPASIMNAGIDTQSVAGANAVAATKGGLSLGIKIAIAVASGALVVGGVAGGVYAINSMANKEAVTYDEDWDNDDVEDDDIDDIEKENNVDSDSNSDEDIDVDAIVADFISSYDGNNYFTDNNGMRTVSNENSKYVYYWQGDIPVIFIENDTKYIDGSADDIYEYTMFAVDMNSGGVKELSCAGENIASNITGCDLYEGRGKIVVDVFDWVWKDIDSYYEITTDGTSMNEKAIEDEKGEALVASDDFSLLEWKYLADSLGTEKSTYANYNGDAEEGDRWDTAEKHGNQDSLFQGDCPVYCEYYSTMFYMPCDDSVFTDDGWAADGQSVGDWEIYYNSNYPGFELDIMHVPGTNKLCGFRMGVIGFDSVPFNLCVGGINFSSNYDQIISNFGTPRDESKSDNGTSVNYKENGVSMTFSTYMDNNLGKEVVKYIEIMYEP